ncbi:acylphosphatase [Hanamia caeni]|jgi:acylphosphatase|uniref:acylphosphatase n=1 Tax=Hanamia caeni TaxID=2294116 RepID=A0A3M9NFX0_9BACT|nr:acylphosphatase [Hanamia caeni]RNI36113.1 acylphosphatase [Hanamia caeni]
METMHLLISGKVQGVFFRETSRRLAEKLHINGWIKNCADGKVEAVVTGDKSEVEQFIEFCKTGPERAFVEKVEVSKREKTDFKKFEVIRNH